MHSSKQVSGMYGLASALWARCRMRPARPPISATKDEAMIEGMEKTPAPQFNLIGYSYGSLMAAQTAHVYGNNGHVVDHLVLIGSPIDADFLADLQGNPNIQRVIIINLQEHGDPIYAGISQWRLTAASWKLKAQDDESGNTKGIGHFYYRPASEEGKRRRRELAKFLVQEGLQ